MSILSNKAGLEILELSDIFRMLLAENSRTTVAGDFHEFTSLCRLGKTIPLRMDLEHFSTHSGAGFHKAARPWPGIRRIAVESHLHPFYKIYAHHQSHMPPDLRSSRAMGGIHRRSDDAFANSFGDAESNF
jgi:hypothetical protein